MGSNKNRARGKRNEKAVAKLLGGERLGILGKEDVRILGKYYVECKSRDEYPKWFSNMWNQTVKNALPNGIPILQLHITGSQHTQDLIVMTVLEFQKLIGGDETNGKENQ